MRRVPQPIVIASLLDFSERGVRLSKVAKTLINFVVIAVPTKYADTSCNPDSPMGGLGKATCGVRSSGDELNDLDSALDASVARLKLKLKHQLKWKIGFESKSETESKRGHTKPGK